MHDYKLHPGQREALIALFERAFIEPQETLGAHVRASFRDLDDPDRFVWIRSFADAHARFAALDGFYASAVWRANRNAANATIVDSDDVLQLRPIGGAIPAAPLPPIGATATPDALIVAATYFPVSEHAFSAHFTTEAAHLFREIHAGPFALFATEHAVNCYPRLPIRDDKVFVTLTRFASVDAHQEICAAHADIERAFAPLLAAPTQIRRLQPTARSTLR